MTDWWGFELAIPPAMIKSLSSVASVQQTFFTFLQAFVIAGGESCPKSLYCLFVTERMALRGSGMTLQARLRSRPSFAISPRTPTWSGRPSRPRIEVSSRFCIIRR